jgi:hypothetical protein
MLKKFAQYNSLGVFGDFRLDQTGHVILKKAVDKAEIKMKPLSKNRAEQVRFQRFIWNEKVTIAKMEKEIYGKTKELAKDVEHVLAIQDSSELNYNYRKHTIDDLGVIKNSKSVGIFIHPVIAIDAQDDFAIGLAANHMWSWDPNRKIGQKRDADPIEEKESYRWIKCALDAKETLKTAKKVTFISDRESDIYQIFTEIPDEKTHVIIRSKTDRHIVVNGVREKLLNYINHIKVTDTRELLIKRQAPRDLPRYNRRAREKIEKGREKRVALLELRYGPLEILRSVHLRHHVSLEKTAQLWVINVQETGNEKGNKDKIHWRLITTHPVTTAKEAWEIVDFYKKRWLIEQYFRSAKKGGLRLEDIGSTKLNYLEKMVFIGLVATIKIIQLTYCRDLKVDRPASLLFNKEELQFLPKLNKYYEGKTTAQKNPYKKNTVSWAYWIIGRHGGWKGYDSEGPAGPYIIKEGLDKLQKNVEGIRLFKDVCIT